MCPVSGLVQFLIIVLTLLLICHSIVVHSLNIVFKPNNVSIHMYDSVQVNYMITGEPPNGSELEIYVENPSIVMLEKDFVVADYQQLPLKGVFNLTGKFLGETKIHMKIVKQNNELINGKLPVIVTRTKRPIDTIFYVSVGTLVSIIYINFGCALNWSELRKNIHRPVGPLIGFIGQFLIMPILSFTLGKLIFPNNPSMQLGMFFTGISPAGGASNIWTLLLDGNVDLSITMTTISTFAAFIMMPLWFFLLGKQIFEQSNLVVPYIQFTTYAIALIVPLYIGYLISKKMKNVAQFLVRILKGFSAVLILFIVIFAIVTNLYLFKLFSWKIIVAGMALPYMGLIIAFIIAKLLRQPHPDCIAIAVETSIQNTGIAIFLLGFSLPQPQADLTTVAPVSVAMMTPLPFILIFFYKKIKNRISENQHYKLNAAQIKDLNDGNDNFDNNFNRNDIEKVRNISTIST